MSADCKFEPTLRQREWLCEETVIRTSIVDDCADWKLTKRFWEILFPRNGGARYAHVDLLTLSHLTTVAQEQSYRSLLAVAADAKIWRSWGGVCDWIISPRDIAKAWGRQTDDVKEFRRYALTPLKTALEKAGSRLRIDELRVDRDKAAQGRKASEITIVFRVLPARECEQPNSGVYLNRTVQRQRQEGDDRVEYRGSGVIDLHARAELHRKAVIDYHARKRARKSLQNADASKPPAPRFTPPAKPDFDDIDSIFESLLASSSDANARVEREEAERKNELSRHFGVDFTGVLWDGIPADVCEALAPNIEKQIQAEVMEQRALRRRIIEAEESSPGIHLSEYSSQHPSVTLMREAEEYYERCRDKEFEQQICIEEAEIDWRHLKWEDRPEHLRDDWLAVRDSLTYTPLTPKPENPSDR